MDKWFAIGFAAGLVVGGVIGVLTAPSGGAATRDRMMRAVQPSLVRLNAIRVSLGVSHPSDLEVIKQAI